MRTTNYIPDTCFFSSQFVKKSIFKGSFMDDTDNKRWSYYKYKTETSQRKQTLKLSEYSHYNSQNSSIIENCLTKIYKKKH